MTIKYIISYQDAIVYDYIVVLVHPIGFALYNSCVKSAYLPVHNEYWDLQELQLIGPELVDVRQY